MREAGAEAHHVSGWEHSGRRGSGLISPSGVPFLLVAAQVWASPEDTEIPGLRRYVHGAALERRRANMLKKAEAVVQFCDSIAVLVADDGDANKGLHAQVKAAFNAAVMTG
mmetsp:Transcript_17684/g.44875  ORF Transcript_17684/g.44875 Transcript_17684/m.44875 type:complete len:111 (-) Transcript_17684:83-415(-)